MEPSDLKVRDIFCVVKSYGKCPRCDDVTSGFELVPWYRYDGDNEYICGVCRGWYGHSRDRHTATKKLYRMLNDWALPLDRFLATYEYNLEGRLEWNRALTSKTG